MDRPFPLRLGVIVCDVSHIVDPGPAELDALARLQLTARRLGTTIRLHNAAPALVDLIAIAGLADVLVTAESGVEVDGKVEQLEQRGVDEEVHRRDRSG